MCLTDNNFGLQKKPSTSPNSRERPLIRKTGWGTTERKREGECAVFYEKEDESMLDVENVETTKGVAI